jgi:hypothetical protein
MLQSQIWHETVRSIGLHVEDGFSVPLLLATIQMFSVAEQRRAAIEARIPSREIRVLIVLAVGTAAMIGTALAALGARHFYPVELHVRFVRLGV